MNTSTAAAPAQTAARQHVEAGEAALAKADYQVAIAEYDQAITAIGDTYAKEGTLDDTGMQLVLADSKAKQGDLAAAAKLKASVARARLALLAGKPR